MHSLVGAARGSARRSEAYGAIPGLKLDEVASCVAGYVGRAREHGVERVEVLVTSRAGRPRTRSSCWNGSSARSSAGAGASSAAEEASLAFTGALAELPELAATSRVAVVDVGGGSAQIAVGTRGEGVTWTRSIDVGATRLDAALLPEGEPRGRRSACPGARRGRLLLEGVEPPPVEGVLAVGKAARGR